MHRLNKIISILGLLVLCASMLMVCKTSQAGKLFASRSVIVDSIFVKVLQSKKPSAFELYPDASHTVLLFAAKGEKGKLYQLFLFNMDGKLTKQIQVHSEETSLLSGLQKGDYIFEVLSDDDRIGNGNIAIR